MTDHLDMDRRTALKHLGLAALAGSLMTRPSELCAQPVDAAAGSVLADKRLGELRTLNSYFPFTPSASAEEWQKRAEYVRRRILVASGLWPVPESQPVEAVVHGLVDRPEYTVERAYFESAPGLFVTGSLYRPKSAAGKLPAILCPHGHWANGRFFDHGEEAVKQELNSGAEKFPVSGRYPLQARCVQLARMGCLVFHYDMIGYADSAPITETVGHRLNEQRKDLVSPDHWGLFSAQAELRLINVLGLQTFNSMRVLDWLTSMPDVDASRIGVTGASGGGTQTFLLAAVDSRPAAAVPAVMVSTAMQGGCTCENASYLRIDTGNIEFAALAAPRPLGLTAANDWTREIETKGLPELRQHYEMLGVPDRLEGKYFDFGHNYNYVSRAMMYEFFNKHLGLGQSSPIVEQDFEPLTRDELTVWTGEHPKPACDVAAEVALLRRIDADWQQQFATLAPRDAKSGKKFRDTVAPAIDVMIGRQLPAAGDVTTKGLAHTGQDNYVRAEGTLQNVPAGEEIPVVYLLPRDWNKTVVLWAHGEGKKSLFTDSGAPRPEVRQLLDQKIAVGAVDVLYTGEFLADGQPITAQRQVPGNREVAAFTMGYNHPLFAQRVHDLLTLIAFTKNHSSKPERIHLLGLGGAAPWAAAACVQAGPAIDKLGLDTQGFRFATITKIDDVNLWPGAVKYGDLPGLLALCAPHPLALAGEGPQGPELTVAAYRAAEAASRITPLSGNATQALPQLIEWIARA